MLCFAAFAQYPVGQYDTEGVRARAVMEVAWKLFNETVFFQPLRYAGFLSLHFCYCAAYWSRPKTRAFFVPKSGSALRAASRHSHVAGPQPGNMRWLAVRSAMGSQLLPLPFFLLSTEKSPAEIPIDSPQSDDRFPLLPSDASSGACLYNYSRKGACGSVCALRLVLSNAPVNDNSKCKFRTSNRK